MMTMVIMMTTITMIMRRRRKKRRIEDLYEIGAEVEFVNAVTAGGSVKFLPAV